MAVVVVVAVGPAPGRLGARLGARFGRLGARLGARFGRLGARLGARFGRLGARLGASFGRLGDRLGARFGRLGDWLGRTTTRPTPEDIAHFLFLFQVKMNFLLRRKFTIPHIQSLLGISNFCIPLLFWF